ERLETFMAQTAQHVDGGYVGVALGTAAVFALGKDGRRGAAHLLFGQRGLAADDESGVTETGGQRTGSLNGVHGEGSTKEMNGRRHDRTRRADGLCGVRGQTSVGRRSLRTLRRPLTGGFCAALG